MTDCIQLDIKEPFHLMCCPLYTLHKGLFFPLLEAMEMLFSIYYICVFLSLCIYAGLAMPRQCSLFVFFQTPKVGLSIVGRINY